MAIRRKTYKGYYTDGNEVFVCDTAADLSQLPADSPQGSSAFVIDDSTTYMIDSSGTWTEVQLGNSGGGGGITLDNLSVTENGVYTPDNGHAYKKVTVAVEDTPDPEPADGKTHIWARIDEDTPDERKGFTLAWNQSVSNGVEIDWGDSGTIVETLSGHVVSFSGDVSVNSIAAGIVPVQKGSGDPAPDNVRPISGWTGAKVTRCGKNLIPNNYAFTSGTTLYGVTATVNDDGSIHVVSAGTGSSTAFFNLNVQNNPNIILPTGTYSVSGGLSGKVVINVKNAASGVNLVSPFTLTEPTGLFMYLSCTSSAAFDVVVYPQLEVGSVATGFEPYAGEVFNVTFPTEAGTVYGGTLDLTAGTLTVDTVYLELNSSMSIVEYAYADRNGVAITNILPFPENHADGICSHSYNVGWGVTENTIWVGVNSSHVHWIGILDILGLSTVEEFKTWLGTQTVQIAYKLGNPANYSVYQLTPQQIAALAGINTVWTDTGDMTVEIEYQDIQTVSGTGAVSLTHQYENGGEYEITMEAVEGNISFTGTSGTAGTSIYGSKANAQCYNRQRITRISVGANAAVGSYMANYCYSLSRIGLPSTLTSIGAHAFEECFSLPSVKIPDGVTSIGEYAFSYCHSLESADIPDSCTSIGAYAFQNCYGLREADFPSGLTSISDYTYQGCYNLTSLDIPDTVTSIGNGAFHSCYGLTSITIPASVTSIGDSAFLNCYGISEYHIGATTPPTLVSTNAFTGMASGCVIYVPRSANQAVLNAYKAATNWVTYASRMQEEAE